MSGILIPDMETQQALEEERSKLMVEIKKLPLMALTYGELGLLSLYSNGVSGMIFPATKEKNEEVRVIVNRVKEAMRPRYGREPF